MCKCENIEFGTYEVSIPTLNPFSNKVVDIDFCILPVIEKLWSLGIETVESCCGHNKTMGYVAVKPIHSTKMINLGFKIDDRTEASHCFKVEV